MNRSFKIIALAALLSGFLLKIITTSYGFKHGSEKRARQAYSDWILNIDDKAYQLLCNTLGLVWLVFFVLAIAGLLVKQCRTSGMYWLLLVFNGILIAMPNL